MSDQQSPQTQSSSGGSDAEQNKVMAILAYIFFFVPLLTGDYKKSPFVKYHTNQGTVLFIFAVIWSIVLQILTRILVSIFLRVGLWSIWSIFSLLLSLAGLVPLILCILGIVNAAKLETKPLPVIGKFTIIK